MKFYQTLVLFIFYSNLVFSQNFEDKTYALVDSIELSVLEELDREILIENLDKFHSAKQDSIKIKVIISICDNLKNEIWIKYNDFLFEYVNDKISQLKSEDNDLFLQKSLAISYSNYGFYHDLKGNANLAIENYHQALNIRIKLEDKKAVAYSIIDIGYIYKIQGDIEKALNYFFSALKLLEELDDKKGMAAALNNIGLIYYNQRDLKLAEKYQKKSLHYKQEINDEVGIAVSLSNLGLIYYSKNDSTNALNNYRQSLEILEKLDYQHGIASVLYNIGEVYSKEALLLPETKKASKFLLYEKSITYYKQVLSIRESIQDQRGLSFCLDKIASVYVELGNLQTAKEYSERSLDLANKIGYPENIERSSKLLSTIYEKENNGMAALKLFKLSLLMRDSVKNSNAQKVAIEQNIQYEYDKKSAISKAEFEKDLAISAAQKKEQRIIIFGVSVLFLIGFIFSIVFYKKLKLTRQQKTIIEQKNNENKVLLGEIHHRVKNNLQVISSLLSLQEKNITDDVAKSAILEGKERVKSMGLIHKMLYQNDNFSGVEMKNYIDKLLEGLMDSFGLNQVGLKINTEFKDVKLDVDSAIPLGLIINELVINAFKYAYENIENPEITVTLNQQNEGLMLMIKDNGNGDSETVKNSKSFGFKLVKSLVRQLNGELTLFNKDGLVYSILIKDYKLV